MNTVMKKAATVRTRMRKLGRELGVGEDGAIMIMGTFMGIALIGATWYVLGLGDAIIYKEKVQEAADAGAFSAAAVHAKGMNFIAAMNIVLVVLTILWLIINMVEDVLGAVLDIVGNPPGKFGNISCELDGNEVIPSIGGTSFNVRRSCCEAAGAPPSINAIVLAGGVASGGASDGIFCTISNAVHPVHDKVRDARKKYADILDKVMPAIGGVETVVKVLTPPAGFAAGLLAGSNYNETALTIGASMVPLGGVGGFGGLPLQKREFGDLCEHAILNVFDWVNTNLLGNIPGVGTLINNFPFDKIVGIIETFIADGIQGRYCDGDRGGPFDKEGFQIVRPGIQNGGDFFSMWTFVPSSQNDTKAKIVPIGTGRVASVARAAAPPASTSNTYLAQAEYYYDCGEEWDGADCNDNNNAMFGIRWKARLRRVKKPSIGADIAQEVNGLISNQLEAAADLVAPTASGDFSSFGTNGAVGYVFDTASEPVTGAISGVGAALDPSGFTPTVVH